MYIFIQLSFWNRIFKRKKREKETWMQEPLLKKIEGKCLNRIYIDDGFQSTGTALQIFYVLPWQLINFTETASSKKYLIKVYLTMFWWFRFFRKPSIRRYVYEKAGKQNWCFWYLAPRFAPKCVNRCVGFFCLK